MEPNSLLHGFPNWLSFEPAIEEGDRVVTYGQLWDIASSVAQKLTGSENELVAVCLTRLVDVAATVLAAVRTGRAIFFLGSEVR